MSININQEKNVISYKHPISFDGIYGKIGMFFIVVFITTALIHWQSSFIPLLIAVIFLSKREELRFNIKEQKLTKYNKVLFFFVKRNEPINSLDQIIIHYHSTFTGRTFIAQTNSARVKGYFLSLGTNNINRKTLYIFDDYNKAVQHARFIKQQSKLEIVDRIKLQMQKQRR